MRRETRNNLLNWGNTSDIDHLYCQTIIYIPSPDLYKERLLLQTEFNSLTTHHTAEVLLDARTTFYVWLIRPVSS